LRARLVEIYKLGQARCLQLILATPDLRHLGQATRTVAALAKLDRDRVASHQQTLLELKNGRAALQARRTELATLRSSAEKAQAASQRAAQARTELVRDIDQKRKTTQDLHLAPELVADVPEVSE
jgi:septal ring factor EnvC (AmiA/AmiB activator)